MRFKAISFLVVFVIISIGLANCGIGKAVAPTAAPVRTKAFTPTLAPTTSTPTPTQIPIPVILPTLPPPTLVVIRNAEELLKQFDTIVAMTNKVYQGCYLPCLWGITPGKTTWIEAEKIINQAGLPAYEYESSDMSLQGLRMFDVGVQEFLGNDILDLDVDFYVHDEIVSYIILEESGTPGNAFIKTWSALSPETLIPKLGVPSSVKVDGYCGEGEGSLITDCSYNLYVSYQRSGIYLNYTLGSRFGRGYPICPTFEEGGNTKNWFRIILKSLDEQTVLGYIGNGYLGATPFEEATGKTINDFYQAYLQSQKPPCFYLLPSFFK